MNLRSIVWSRREALKAAGLGALASLGLGGGVAQGAARSSRQAVAVGAAGKPFRFAHLTDSHIQPERKAFDGVAACLRHAQGHADKPQLIITGGDLIMDGFAADEARTRTQWDLFTKVLKDECSIPVRHCLGNHDIWGWNKTRSQTTGNEPGWGKKWAMDLLGLEKPYYGFDAAGWRVIVLDTVREAGERYKGGLDDEQFAWLQGELAAAGAKPICVVGHIPILHAGVLMTDGKRQADEFLIGQQSMCLDNGRIIDLFTRFPGVKLCLSGHIHTVERIELQGVTYVCSGAVSGAWWRGREAQDQRARQQIERGERTFMPPARAEEGYNLVDLNPDGTFNTRYIDYGWTAASAD